MSSGVKDTAQVADSYQKLYAQLPASIAVSADQAQQQTLTGFLSTNLPQSERGEIGQEAKKTLSIKRVKQVKKSRSRQRGQVKKGKYLTSRERRVLGLHHLTNRGFKFEDCTQMHRLWLDYMRKVVGSAGERPRPQAVTSCAATASIHTLGDEQLQMRVSRADFHGALVKLIKVASHQRLGLEGYVVMETRNTLKILTKQSNLTTVPKKGTAFSFCVDDYLFSIEASNMCIKPSERAIKKWKSKPPLDM